VEDIEGNARLDTSNGAIRFRKIRGRLDAKTSNGAIEGDDLTGDATLRTSNGAIRIDRAQGGMEASTSNGSIHVAASKLRPGQALRFESSNGSLDLEFAELENSEIRATTCKRVDHAADSATTKARLAGQHVETVRSPASWMWRHRARR